MLDPRITADLLEEKLATVIHVMPDDDQLHGAMRDAIRHLRQDERNTMLTIEQIRDFKTAFSVGAEIACYMERRGYYKPEAVVVENMSETMLMIRDAVSRESLGLASYNLTWRLYSEYPSAHERQKHKWKDG